MRKILAITVALMIAAIVLMPALGYTNQAAGKLNYSAKSGNQVEHSFKTINVPAHNLTPDMVANKYSFKSAAVQSTRMPYSFQQGSATPYSFKLVGVENAVAQGMKTKKPVAELGSLNKMDEAERVEQATEPANAPLTASTNVTPAAPPVEPKFSIEGMVVDNNQTGLGNWTVNLTKGVAVINSVATAASGKFAFPDLTAGQYTVSEALKEGWNIVSPAEGMTIVDITDTSATNLVFVNEPVAVVPVAAAPAVAENVTAPVNETLSNATVKINTTV